MSEDSGRPGTPQTAELPHGRPTASPGTPPTSARARRVAEIRSWRDQTEGIYGLPHYPSDPPLVTNNKGWWRDVCDLLDVLDGKPARSETR